MHVCAGFLSGGGGKGHFPPPPLKFFVALLKNNGRLESGPPKKYSDSPFAPPPYEEALTVCLWLSVHNILIHLLLSCIIVPATGIVVLLCHCCVAAVALLCVTVGMSPLPQAIVNLNEHVAEYVSAVAMASGYLQRYQSMVQVRHQTVVVLMSDWTVLCFDHTLKLLWKVMARGEEQEKFPISWVREGHGGRGRRSFLSCEWGRGAEGGAGEVSYLVSEGGAQREGQEKFPISWVREGKESREWGRGRRSFLSREWGRGRRSFLSWVRGEGGVGKAGMLSLWEGRDHVCRKGCGHVCGRGVVISVAPIGRRLCWWLQ